MIDLRVYVYLTRIVTVLFFFSLVIDSVVIIVSVLLLFSLKFGIPIPMVHENCGVVLISHLMRLSFTFYIYFFVVSKKKKDVLDVNFRVTSSRNMTDGFTNAKVYVLIRVFNRSKIYFAFNVFILIFSA